MEKQAEKRERKPRKQGKRSPGYPMIGLDEAIQRAKTLWDKDKNNYIPLAAAYEHLGYKPKGSYGARIISALKKFELIYEKQDAIKLTEEAVDLVLHEPSDELYIETLKKLALKPAIYEKIFNEYNRELPSDSTLRIKLIKDFEFNPESVDDFISCFKKTLEFAGLIENKKIDKEEKDKILLNKEKKMITSRDSGYGVDSSKLMIEIPIPVSETELASLKMPYPLTDAQWNKIESILKAYKPTPDKSDVQVKDETKES